MNKKDSLQPTLNQDETHRLAQELMLKDSVLPKSVDYINQPVKRHKIENILLIGSTGIVGPYLLYEILRKTQATIYCLIRKQQDIDSKQRILNELKKYHLLDHINPDRIIAIEGNITKPNLGLDDKTYQTLSHDIDMVFHNAAWTNHIRPYAWPHTLDKSDLRETNALSLRDVLIFASTNKTKYVNFTSTVATINRCDMNGYLVEELPSINNVGDFIYMGYPQTKFVAEKLIQQAISRGIPCRVFRLGIVTGDSKTGIAFAQNDHVMLEIKACTQMGIAPEWHTSRNFLAVDVLTEIMAILGLEENIVNSAYNIVNPSSATWEDIITYLNHQGYQIKSISEKKWLEQLAHIDDSNALFRLKDAYLSQGTMDKTMPTMCSLFQSKINFERTLNALARHYVKFPSSMTLFDKYIKYFEQTGFFMK